MFQQWGTAGYDTVYAENYPESQMSSFEAGDTLIDPENHIYNTQELHHYNLAHSHWISGGTPVFYDMNNCVIVGVETSKPDKTDFYTNIHQNNFNQNFINFGVFNSWEYFADSAIINNQQYPWKYVQWANPEGQFNEMVYDSEFRLMFNRFNFSSIGDFQPVSIKIELLTPGFVHRAAMYTGDVAQTYSLNFPNVTTWHVQTNMSTLTDDPVDGIYLPFPSGGDTLIIPNYDMMFGDPFILNLNYFYHTIWTLNFKITFSVVPTLVGMPGEFTEWTIPLTLRFGAQDEPVESMLIPSSWGG